MAERVTLVFRYDDYHASLGEATAAQDDIERRFLEAFADREVPLTLGVVPRFQGERSLGDDPEKLAALQAAVAAGRAEAALHGLTHTSSAPEGQRASEFASLPPDAQLERLREGKATLEEWAGDGAVATFIPPWNTFDEATLAALGELGFLALSAALSELPAEELVELPQTCGLRDVPRVLEWLTGCEGHSFVVCIFHHFSFLDSPDPLARTYGQMTVAELAPLLADCRRAEGVECLTVAEAARRYHDELTDGRVAEAAERWHLVFRWRRTPVLGALLRRLWAPQALLEPGAWDAGNRWLRRLPGKG
jgi:predicted deacetylase